MTMRMDAVSAYPPGAYATLHPDYPGIHKRYQTRHDIAMGDATPNLATCSAPRCFARRFVDTMRGCCNLDCPHHFPKDYRGRHRA